MTSDFSKDFGDKKAYFHQKSAFHVGYLVALSSKVSVRSQASVQRGRRRRFSTANDITVYSGFTNFWLGGNKKLLSSSQFLAYGYQNWHG